MKNTKRKLKAGLLLLLIVTILVPSISGLAASKKQKAMAAYKKWLNKSTVYVLPKNYKFFSIVKDDMIKYKGDKKADVKFALVYLDKDNIPEMIVKGKGDSYSVLTYKNGKVVRLFTPEDDFTVPKKYYKKKNMFITRKNTFIAPEYYGHAGENVVRKVSGKYMQKLTMYAEFEGQEEYYEFFKGREGKKISKSTYLSCIRSYAGGISATSIRYYKNTSANRKKRLR